MESVEKNIILYVFHFLYTEDIFNTILRGSIIL